MNRYVPDSYTRMVAHSQHLWTAFHDGQFVTRLSPSASVEESRELAILGHMVVCETITSDGVWVYRASRTEAEWRTDLDIDARRGAPCMKAYPRPLGTFTQRRRQTLEVSTLIAMFGDIAA